MRAAIVGGIIAIITLAAYGIVQAGRWAPAALQARVETPAPVAVEPAPAVVAEAASTAPAEPAETAAADSADAPVEMAASAPADTAEAAPSDAAAPSSDTVADAALPAVASPPVAPAAAAPPVAAPALQPPPPRSRRPQPLRPLPLQPRRTGRAPVVAAAHRLRRRLPHPRPPRRQSRWWSPSISRPRSRRPSGPPERPLRLRRLRRPRLPLPRLARRGPRACAGTAQGAGHRLQQPERHEGLARRRDRHHRRSGLRFAALQDDGLPARPRNRADLRRRSVAQQHARRPEGARRPVPARDVLQHRQARDLLS